MQIRLAIVCTNNLVSMCVLQIGLGSQALKRTDQFDDEFTTFGQALVLIDQMLNTGNCMTIQTQLTCNVLIYKRWVYVSC